MGPKLQKRFDRNVEKTRIDLDRVIGRLNRLGKQDLDDSTLADVELVAQALATAEVGLQALEALTTFVIPAALAAVGTPAPEEANAPEVADVA